MNKISIIICCLLTVKLSSCSALLLGVSESTNGSSSPYGTTVIPVTNYESVGNAWNNPFPYGNVVAPAYNSKSVEKEWHNCSQCGGSGKCKYCGGSGRDEYTRNKRCGICRGTGKCAGCNGKGGYKV